MTGPPSPLLIIKLYSYTKWAAVNILPMTIKGIWSHREQHILETSPGTNVCLSAFSSAPEQGILPVQSLEPGTGPGQRPKFLFLNFTFL